VAAGLISFTTLHDSPAQNGAYSGSPSKSGLRLEVGDDEVDPERAIGALADRLDPPPRLVRRKAAAAEHAATAGARDRDDQLGPGTEAHADGEDRVLDPELPAKRGLELDRHDGIVPLCEASRVDAIEELKRVEGLELAPGLSPAEIDALEAELGVPLPASLRALLQQTAGIDGGELGEIDFTGRTMSYEDEDVFPSGLPVAGDGFGNFWVLDLTPDGAEPRVFFACHDPPVILHQSPDIGHFLREVVKQESPPHESLVDDVHDDRLFNVWGENPGTLDHAAALAGDEQLRAFASELDERWVFVDLRASEIGMGFSWGRYGPGTEVRRRGYEPLFAYAQPERKPGLLKRLFG
jgi:cell wall assembly regulator SMI1